MAKCIHKEKKGGWLGIVVITGEDFVRYLT